MDECKGHIIGGYIVQENGIVRDSEHKIVGRLNDLNRIAELEVELEQAHRRMADLYNSYIYQHKNAWIDSVYKKWFDLEGKALKKVDDE